MAPRLDIATAPRLLQRVTTPSAPAPTRRRPAAASSPGLARPAMIDSPAGPTVLT